MLTDAEITAAATRLASGKLRGKDIDSLVSAFRTVIGPLESTYAPFNDLVADLEALDDTANTYERAAKMAACHLRLVNEDFGVSDLVGELENSDNEQRKLFIVYALSILYPIPAELAYLDPQSKGYLLNRRLSMSVPVTFVP